MLSCIYSFWQENNFGQTTFVNCVKWVPLDDGVVERFGQRCGFRFGSLSGASSSCMVFDRDIRSLVLG
jgi:hypothetical protein